MNNNISESATTPPVAIKEIPCISDLLMEYDGFDIFKRYCEKQISATNPGNIQNEK